MKGLYRYKKKKSIDQQIAEMLSTDYFCKSQSSFWRENSEMKASIDSYYKSLTPKEQELIRNYYASTATMKKLREETPMSRAKMSKLMVDWRCTVAFYFIVLT